MRGYFPKHEILERVGRGGMGVVYRAKHVELDRMEALKLMDSWAICGGTRALERFQLEARAQAKLSDHPNIVPIYDIGEAEGIHYISMKWIEGGHLGAHIDRLRADLGLAASVISRVSRAVATVHKERILHRDLKPQNILLDLDQNPYVSDFGLASLLEEPNALTLTGEIIGTPAYLAPEQITGPKRPSVSIDVWALGVILYQVITGRLPFKGANDFETMTQIVKCVPRPPSEINPQVGDFLQAICLRCLEKDPKGRVDSAESLAEALDEWTRKLRGYGGPAPKPPLVPSGGKPLRVVIADDHPIFRAGLRAKLEEMMAVSVIGEASDGREALEVVRREKPDLVLMDVSMPGLDGLEATSRMVRDHPGMKVIMITRHEDEEYFLSALRVGAKGYLLKRAAILELKAAVERVMGDEIYISKEIGRNLTHLLLRLPKSPLEVLSERQREILQLIAEGNGMQEIASRLQISIKTVEYHRMQLMNRLNVLDIPSLVRLAHRYGMADQTWDDRE
jgi:DNA-binding NarL/FixJ family response regulator